MKHKVINPERYTNCKMSKKVLKHVMHSNISSCELSVLMWLIRRQDVFGRVFDVKYYDICKDLSISHQQFYNAINNLTCLSFTRIINRSNKYGWDIEIYDNGSTGTNDDKLRYLSLNTLILSNNEFNKLRANEKKIALYILFNKANSIFYLQYATITKWIGIDNKQLIKSYINSLSKLFNISFSKESKLFVFTGVYYDNISEIQFDDEFTYLYGHKITSLLRRAKVKNITEKLIYDAITLVKQYKESAGIHNVLHLIYITSLTKRKFEPSYINWAIKHFLSEGKLIG